MISTNTNKNCTKCKESKSLQSFYKHKNTKDGYSYWCKDCTLCSQKDNYKKNAEKKKEYQKGYAKDNRKSVLASKKKHYQGNRERITKVNDEWKRNNEEKVKEIKRNWRIKNKEKAIGSNKIYRANNKEKIAEYHKKYRHENAGSINNRTAKRRAKKLNATPVWADDWKIEQFYIMARKLTDSIGIKFVVDHIIPLQSKIVSGLHTENNLQIISEEENAKKHNKFEPIEGL